MLSLVLLVGCLGFDPGLSLFFQNVSTWGDKAAGCLVTPTCQDDVVLLAEHHMNKDRLQQMIAHGRRQHWQTIISPARVKNGGTSGGECIFYKEHLDLRPAPLPASLPEVGVGFAMGVWRLRRCEVLVAAVYVRPWIPGEARSVWRALAARIFTLGIPTILAGDWNMDREQLVGTGWPGKLGLVAVPTDPPDHPTCTQGGQGHGRAIDYFLVSESLADLVVGSEVVMGLGFRPHFGVRLHLRGRPRDVWRRQLRLPRPWPGHDDKNNITTVKMEGIAWNEAVVNARPPSWRQAAGALELKNCMVHWPPEWLEQADVLDGMAVLWSAAAEQQLCSMFGQVDGRYLGRGRAPVFDWKRVHPIRPTGAVGPHDSILFTVSVLAARLQDLVRIVDTKACGTRLCQGLLRMLRRMSLPEELANETVSLTVCDSTDADGDRVRDWSGRSHGAFPSPAVRRNNQIPSETHSDVSRGRPHIGLLPQPESWQHVNTTWGNFVRRPLAFPKGCLRRAAEVMALRAERLGRQAAQTNRLKFANWVDEAAGSARVAHRWTKQNESEEELLAQQHARAQGHLRAMDIRTAFWQVCWQRHSAQWSMLVEHISDLRLQVADDIREDRVQLLADDQLDAAIAEYKPCKAKGADGWSTAFLAHLVGDARMELLNLFRACERGGMWPTCWMATLAKFLPKPDGGERPILLLNLFYRLWIKARGGDLVEWEEQHGSPFDRALRGCSALRAALGRAMRMEAAVASGQQAVVVMVDCEKFYDNVNLSHLIALSREVNYPRMLLLMGVLQYLSPRFCSAGGHVSEAVTVYGSIAPGCGQAVGMTRPLLHSILAWAGQASPMATLEAYVDDLVLAVISPSVHAAASTTVRLGRALWQRLGSIGCIVSQSKSQVVCSSKDMEAALADMMVKHGWLVKFDRSAKDLGVDMAAGRRRCVRIQKVRFGKFKKRVQRMRRLTRASARALPLYLQAQPQATWGQEVMGLAPSHLQGLRREALRATGLNTTGMCTTTTLACVYGWRRDPAISTLLSQVVAWVEAWRGDDRLRQEVRAAWPAIVADLDGPRPWIRAKGPAAAMVLTMRRYGWEAVAPDHWVDPRGAHWHPTMEATNMDLFLDELAEDVSTVLWASAAQHWQGLGLGQGGPDQWVLGKILSKAKTKNTWVHTNMIKIIGGGCWTKQRCSQLLLSRPSPMCPRCGAAEESDFHRWWECPANDRLRVQDPEAFSTQVALHAYRFASEFPCFVSRGIIPSTLTATSPPPDATEGHYCPELKECTRRVWSTRRDVFTDGSGGDHSADPRLRRCGWGFVVLAPPLGWGSDGEVDLEVEGMDDEEVHVEFEGFGALAGPVQKVGRAELEAAIRLFTITAGPLSLYTDYKAMVTGFEGGPTKTMQSRMADMWESFWAALDARPGGRAHVAVLKVKAHAPEEQARQERWTRLWHGNRLADLRASRGAALIQVSPQDLKRINLHSAMAELFLRRMAVILESVLCIAAGTDRPPRTERIPPWTRRRRIITRAILDSGHHLVLRTKAGGGMRMVCTRCLAVRRRGQSLLPWLRHRACPGVPPADGRPIAVCPLAHHSHHLQLHGDVAICGRCGCYAGYGNGIRRLRDPCTGRPARRMAENMRNLHNGRHPHGGPLRDLGLSTLLELDCLVV